jgi:hypothetical protein
MECTHQSTADAISMHARLNIMNARVMAKRNNTPLTLDLLNKSACFAIGYHQGCYRLGLLSLSDVDSTIMRMLSVLKYLGDFPIQKIDENMLKSNLFYSFMDKFEQVGLLDTLKAYQGSGVDITAEQLLTLITSHLSVPVPGARADFSLEVPYQTFVFDYDRMLLNRNPALKKATDVGVIFGEAQGALDEFLINVSLQAADIPTLIANMLKYYLNRYYTDDYRTKATRNFLMRLPEIKAEYLEKELGVLYMKTHIQKDEDIRDEGHLHTAIVLLAGVMNDPDFREKMFQRQQELKGELESKLKL